MAQKDIPYGSFASTSDDTEEEGGPWAAAASGSLFSHYISSGSLPIPMLGFTGSIVAELDVSELGASNTTLYYHWAYQGCYDGLAGGHVITSSIGQDQYSDTLSNCPLVTPSPDHQGIVMTDSNNHVKISLQIPSLLFVVDNMTAFVGGFKLQLSADGLVTSDTPHEVGSVSSSVERTQTSNVIASSTYGLPSSTLGTNTPSGNALASFSTVVLSVSLPTRSIHASPPNFSTALNTSSAASAIAEQQTSSRIVPIVCGTIGGLLFLGLVILACVWRLRRYRDIPGEEDTGDLPEDGKTVVAEDDSQEGSFWPRKSYGYGTYTKE